MLFPNYEPSLGGPIGPALAYGKIIRDTENPRSIEHRVFDEITAALQEAMAPEMPFTKRIAAAHRNRELWVALTCDVASEDNTLPDSLRASIISLGLWVFRETSRVIREGGSLADLITVNLSIMRGLRPAS